MRVRGISCENTRRIVERTVSVPGWRFDGVTRGGHGQLRWQPDPEVEPVLLFFGMSPGDRNAWKKLAVDVERVSGVVVWQRTKHGAAHRRPSSTPESARLQRERDRFAVEPDARAARRAQAKAAASADRRRREIGDLMRPG